LALVDGTIYLAWTSSDPSRSGLYRNIRFAISDDGGFSWRKADGSQLTLPILADETGAADGIVLPDEWTYQTWLSSMLVKDGMIHFMYRAAMPTKRQHYIRFDLANAVKVQDTYPRWQGEILAIEDLDGFFASDLNQPNSILYAISSDARIDKGKQFITVLASKDNGQTWFDYAVSRQIFYETYSIGGNRQIGASGKIIGTFTNHIAGQSIGYNLNEVWFFSLDAE
jgi:hypothetical protein